MRNIRKAFALLFTAILCMSFVACDGTPKGKQPPTEPSAVSEADRPVTEESVTTEKETEATVQAPTEKTTALPITTIPVTTTLPITTTAITTTTVASKPEKETDLIITDEEDSDYESMVIYLTNKERAAAGLPKLEQSDELTRAAQIRAKEIVTKFSHTRPDGSSCFTVSPLAFGENLAKGHGTPQRVMEEWMSSEGHRYNILYEDFTMMGVGVYYDSKSNQHHWVQLFG